MLILPLNQSLIGLAPLYLEPLKAGDKREKRNGKSVTGRDVKSLPDEAVRRKEACRFQAAAPARQRKTPVEWM
ncbi:unnamed protein product [Pleuronectes platessa]|uniref:Uncharacterized protein n=1 Tax=Pleuronectes platessa TaxID=8262 RepID=A0A9N7UB28_PLEPL|nr:unnamed protein product [Pleuronectes platessa]